MLEQTRGRLLKPRCKPAQEHGPHLFKGLAHRLLLPVRTWFPNRREHISVDTIILSTEFLVTHQVSPAKADPRILRLLGDDSEQLTVVAIAQRTDTVVDGFEICPFGCPGTFSAIHQGGNGHARIVDMTVIAPVGEQETAHTVVKAGFGQTVYIAPGIIQRR